MTRFRDYGDVSDAIHDWSKHHDSSPLEKGIQAAWDDLTCSDTLNSLLNINNSWNHCRLHAAQESHIAAWSEAFPIASVGNLLSPDELRITTPSELVPKSLKAQNAPVAKLLMSWDSMVSPILKMQAASQGIQPSTPSSRGHWPALVSPLPWSLSAWLTMEGGRMTWLWAPGTEAGAWCGTQQLWTLLLRAIMKTPPDRLVLRRSFCKIHCSLSCAVLPCALVKYLVNRMAYDESTAWFRVQHWLKPLHSCKLSLPTD